MDESETEAILAEREAPSEHAITSPSAETPNDREKPQHHVQGESTIERRPPTMPRDFEARFSWAPCARARAAAPA